MPTILVVGKGLTKGVVEVRDRLSGDREEIEVDNAVAHVIAAVRG